MVYVPGTAVLDAVAGNAGKGTVCNTNSCVSMRYNTDVLARGVVHAHPMPAPAASSGQCAARRVG